MVMSQGTYTFLACFAGFWLVWALIVMVCCFCSFLQRKLKRRREDRLREQCLRALELEPLECTSAAYPSREPLECTGAGYPSRESLDGMGMGCSPREALECTGARYPLRGASGVYRIGMASQGAASILPASSNDAFTSTGRPHHHPRELDPTTSDACGKPPCYEEAVLMEDPPPPYSEVLADPRGGTYTKPAPRSSREHPESETRKTAFPERGYSSLIRLPSAGRWDSLGHLLATMDLNHNNLPAEPQASAMATMPREGRTHADLGLRRLDQGYGLPTAFPLLGRSTAV